ncbi:MAG: FGGY family carbohydrate kinase [Candidatus Njordarchaeum guaymaensis]
MSSEKLLVIDAGSSFLRGYLISTEGKIIKTSKFRWKSLTDPNFPSIIEYDAHALEIGMRNVLKELLNSVDPKDILGISCLAQRMGTVFLGESEQVIYAGPNVDSRGALTDFFIDESMQRDIYRVTGHTPAFLFSPMRYKWFWENDEGTARKIKKILTIHDWIIYFLTGKLVTDPSIASSTLLFDIHKNTWSNEILELYGIDESMLPEIKPTCTVVGNPKKSLVENLGISSDTLIFIGGGDTQFGILSTHCKEQGDIGCVAGYTAPVQHIMDHVIIDQKMRTWTECYILPNKWIFESNPGIVGGIIDWFVGGFVINKGNPYDYLDTVFETISPEKCGVKFYFGNNIMDAKNMADFKPYCISIFSNPGIPLAPKESLETFSRGLIESLAYAVFANINQIFEITNTKIKHFGITGGLSRLRSFTKVLSSLMRTRTYVTSRHEGTALGCAAMMAYKLGFYPSIEDALEKMIPLEEIYVREKDREIYREKYNDWLYYYNQIKEGL